MEEWEATEPFYESHVKQRITETNTARQAPPATCSDTETDQKLFQIWDLEVGHPTCRMLIQPGGPRRITSNWKTDNLVGSAGSVLGHYHRFSPAWLRALQAHAALPVQSQALTRCRDRLSLDQTLSNHGELFGRSSA